MVDMEFKTDEFLYQALDVEMEGVSNQEAEERFFERFIERYPGDNVKTRLHDALRQKYTDYMAREPESAVKFLEHYPQMQQIHGEWRRQQQGYDPVSPYRLEDELVVAHYLSQYDPDLSVSDMKTLFPEQIHELNRESFEDVCRRFGRDEFRRNGVYMTGDDVVDDAFAVFDEEIYEEAEARMDRYMDELADKLAKDETESELGDDEYSEGDLEEVVLF